MLRLVLRPPGISLLCLLGSLNLVILTAVLYPLCDFISVTNNGYNIKIGNTTIS